MQQDRPAKEKRTRWLLSKTGDVIFTASVGSIWLWLVGLALPIGYGGAVAVGVAPPPDELFSRPEPPSPPLPTTTRRQGLIEVTPKSAGDHAGQLATSISLKVTERLASPHPSFNGVRVSYAIRQLRSGSGARNEALVVWSIGREGTRSIRCSEVWLSYSTQQSLADAIARHINNAIQASNSSGEIQCS